MSLRSETSAGRQSATAAAMTRISAPRHSRMRASLISMADSTLTTATATGSGSDVGAATRVTAAPRSRAASATA